MWLKPLLKEWSLDVSSQILSITNRAIQQPPWAPAPMSKYSHCKIKLKIKKENKFPFSMYPAGVSFAPNCVHCFLCCACETSLTPFPQSPTKWLKSALKIFSRLLFIKFKTTTKEHKQTRKPYLCHSTPTCLILQGPDHHPELCVNVTVERSMNYFLAHINILKT